LTSAGWTVADNQIAGAPDIIAERDGERLHVQAEIASEETHSALDHLGSTLISWSPDTPFALAYPLQQGHLDSVARCAPVLQRLGITIFWVADDKTVRWTEARSSPHPVLDARATADEPCAAGSTPENCRLQIIAAARKIAAAGWSDFSPDDIIRALHAEGSPYTDATIRTHIVYSMSRQPELERTGRGRYRLRPAWLQR
jgi:hypothetical protein